MTDPIKKMNMKMIQKTNQMTKDLETMANSDLTDVFTHGHTMVLTYEGGNISAHYNISFFKMKSRYKYNQYTKHRTRPIKIAVHIKPEYKELFESYLGSEWVSQTLNPKYKDFTLHIN
jgi:hypothetical protein